MEFTLLSGFHQPKPIKKILYPSEFVTRKGEADKYNFGLLVLGEEVGNDCGYLGLDFRNHNPKDEKLEVWNLLS